MKTSRLTFLFIVGLLSCISVFASDFEVDGIAYSILSAEERTVEVTKNESIGFYGSEINIPEVVFYNGAIYKVVRIGDYALWNSDIASLNIPATVTSIGNYAFSDCTKLVSIVIPDNVKSIGGGVFWACSSLTSVKMPEGIKNIGESSFYGCSSLSSFTIPESVENIDFLAFSLCSSLTSITIPSKVTNIGDGAFSNCNNLISINVNADNTKYSSIDGVLFSKDQTTIVCYPGGLKGDYIIPDGVEIIGNNAFGSCLSLTSVSIPETVTVIDSYAFSDCSSLTSLAIPSRVTEIGKEAFSNCSNLVSISVSNDNTKYCSVDGILFNKEQTLIICCPGGFKGDYAIPNSVVTIEASAFINCSGLSSIIIPEGVTAIGESAFSGCSSITSLIIPESVSTIGNVAFADCNSLNSIYLNWTRPSDANVSEYVWGYGGNEVFEKATLYIPEGTLTEYQNIVPWNYFKNIQTWSSINEITDNYNFYYNAMNETLYNGCISGNVVIYNVNGEIIKKSYNTRSVNVSELKSGIYIAVDAYGKMVKFRK